MRRQFATAALMALTAPHLALAHGTPPAPAHGGRVLEANENWVELVLAGDRVQIYVLDEMRNAIPSGKISGTAKVLVAGATYKVRLSPVTSTELEGKLPVQATTKDPAIVSLLMDGQVFSARFAAST